MATWRPILRVIRCSTCSAPAEWRDSTTSGYRYACNRCVQLEEPLPEPLRTRIEGLAIASHEELRSQDYIDGQPDRGTWAEATADYRDALVADVKYVIETVSKRPNDEEVTKAIAALPAGRSQHIASVLLALAADLLHTPQGTPRLG
jgi:propanediol dehydratase large subunit